MKRSLCCSANVWTWPHARGGAHWSSQSMLHSASLSPRSQYTTHLRGLGGYIIFAAIFACRSFLGGYYRGGGWSNHFSTTLRETRRCRRRCWH